MRATSQKVFRRNPLIVLPHLKLDRLRRETCRVPNFPKFEIPRRLELAHSPSNERACTPVRTVALPGLKIHLRLAKGEVEKWKGSIRGSTCHLSPVQFGSFPESFA